MFPEYLLLVRQRWMLMAFLAMLSSFAMPSGATPIAQIYEGSISRVFNDPTGGQISPGNVVTGRFDYQPSTTQTRGLVTDWTVVSNGFSLLSNVTEFAYFEDFPGFWIFDLMGDVGGTIGASDFDGSSWIMLDGDLSDFPVTPPPSFGDIVERLGSGQLTFFIEERLSGRSLFEIQVSAENIFPEPGFIPEPSSVALFGLGGLALLALRHIRRTIAAGDATPYQRRLRRRNNRS